MVLRMCVQRGRGERGATLLELLIALVLLGVVTVGIYAMVVTSANAARSTNALLLTQAQVRAALDNIVDEARWAHAVNAADATCVTLSIPQDTPFSAASPYSVTFAYDPKHNTVTRRESTDPGGVGCPPVDPAAADVLAYDVVRPDGSAGLSFEYFDALGTSLGASPALGSVARIRVVVTTTRDGATRTFAGDVALRAR
jgi:prepilin-type N-terminal cleavage/methylation domain-containing protein